MRSAFTISIMIALVCGVMGQPLPPMVAAAVNEPPEPPTFHRLTLGWNPTSDAAAYVVSANNPGTNYTVSATSTSSPAMFLFSTTNTYRVAAVNAGNLTSAWSAPLVVLPEVETLGQFEGRTNLNAGGWVPFGPTNRLAAPALLARIKNWSVTNFKELP